MIDREQLEKVAQAMDAISELGIQSSCDVKSNYKWSLYAWCDVNIEATKCRKLVAIMTPLVGKMTLQDGSWKGEGDAFEVCAYQAQVCKIVGYKIEKKMVKKEIEREPEFEEVEEAVKIPITDCDIKQGKFTEADVEVSA